MGEFDRRSGLGLRHDPDIGLRRFPALRIGLLRVLVGDGAGDDDVFALLPIHGGRDLVLGGELERVDHAQHLVEVAARGHRIDEDQLDLLVRSDDEDVADGLVVGRRALGGVAVGAGGQHAPGLGDLEIGVADHRIVRREALRLLDVGRPARVPVDRIDAQADDLDVALFEFGFDLGHVAKLGGADRGEVLGVREQDGPGIADPVVKFDFAFRRLRLEIRRRVANRESHRNLLT